MFNKQFNCPVAEIFSPYWIAQWNNGIYSCISSPSLFFQKNVNKYEWSRKNKGCASIYPETVGKIANIMHTICTNAFGIYKIQTPSSFNWNITVMELTTLLFYIIFVVISLKSSDRLSHMVCCMSSKAGTMKWLKDATICQDLGQIMLTKNCLCNKFVFIFPCWFTLPRSNDAKRFAWFSHSESLNIMNDQKMFSYCLEKRKQI